MRAQPILRAALAIAVAGAAAIGCASSSGSTPEGHDAVATSDAPADGDAGAPCEETLTAYCAAPGHVCVDELATAIGPGSPYCGAIFGAVWTDGGCGGFAYVIVGATVDQLTKYVYDLASGKLVAVIDQTTIIETCLAGAAGVDPPRSCDDPRNDPSTCCRPTGGGPLACGADAGAD